MTRGTRQNAGMTDAASNIPASAIPAPAAPFGGVIGTTYQESTAEWPQLPAPGPDAPNIIVILLDDVGFGQSSTFGGLIPTPNLDRIASEGLRYNRFHTTAVCGPSRAALLTGRNHHDAGNGFLMEWATGFPSYTTMIPKTTATVAEVLRANGYSTWWYGKNHNTPDWETSVAGPFDRWPTGLGFDYFYGFNAGETHQYYPVLFENTTPVEPDRGPDEGYHFMSDMTDRAISRMRYSKSVAPDKPFFLYFAPGAMHAPHHVAKPWRDKFAGAFDMGWEKYREQVFENQKRMGIVPDDSGISPRPEWVQEWDSLTEEQQRVYCALFENFAGYFAFTDHEVGRLLDAVKELPDGDNTLILYIVGDNGASAEGGPDGTLDEIKNLVGIVPTIDEILGDLDKLGGPETEPHYPIGWAWAGNTPFQWVKQVASHLGGSRNPMVVSWPARITPDPKPRDPFLHLVDIAPTLYEAAGVQMPDRVNGIDQLPLAGRSFLSSFTDPGYRGRPEQYFEIISNRSIYDEGWKANAQHTLPWRQDLASGDWESDRWELYHLDEDFTEARDLADELPEKLTEMKAKFDAAAERYHVYPLDDRGVGRLLQPKPSPPGSAADATRFTFYEGATRLPETAAPSMKNRSWTMTAHLRTRGAETDGVIMAIGGVAGGMTLFLEHGEPNFVYNYYGDHTTVRGDGPVPDGASTVRVEFDYDGGGIGKGARIALVVDDRRVDEARAEKTVFARFGIDTFGIGEDTGQPVTPRYRPPFAFSGRIDRVDIELGPVDLAPEDHAAVRATEIRAAQRRE